MGRRRLGLGNLGICLVGMVFGCVREGGLPDSRGASSAVGGKGETSSVSQGCVPTGMERCFNATDDNCNGVIDEGCGIKTGPVQFEIGWGDSDADVDLSVVGPGGERVDRANRTTPTHLRFERDCPAEDCFGQNYENVYLDGVEPAGGAYVVEVKLRRAEGKTLPIGGRLGVRLGRRTLGVEFVLIEPGEQKVFSFVL